VHWVGGALTNHLLTGDLPRRHGTAAAILVPYQVFDSADRPLCIAAGNDRLFVKFAAAVGHPEWSTDTRFADGRKRAANRAALVALIEPVLKGRPRAHWLAVMEGVGVPAAPVNDIGELARSPQLAAVDLMRRLPGSGMPVVGLPLSFDRERPSPRADSPKLGQHNEEVLD